MRFMSPIICVIFAATCIAQERLNLEYEEYTPIEVKHSSGAQVGVMPWGKTTPRYLEERYFARYSDHTIWCAPPGSYVMFVTGMVELPKIVNIKMTGNKPNPNPPPKDPTDITSKVKELSVGLPSNNNYGLIYKKHSTNLLTTNKTKVQVVNELNADIKQAPNLNSYTDVLKFITAEVNKLWDEKGDLSREELAKFYSEVALGFGVQ